MTTNDPRAVLASLADIYPPVVIRREGWQQIISARLAERGVLLVTRKQVRAAVYKAAENPAHDWHPREEQADDVWAALSGEATE
jgi:hypothetical protein